MTLLIRVAAFLADHHIPHALIGASALAVHGVSRSTLDQDLLAMDQAVLDPAFWTSLGDGIAVDVRRGDAEDPLAGVVRMRQVGERDVDIVVGRHGWQREVLNRAVVTGGEAVPVAELADLILLKLYAGGSQDRWDIEQLLAVHTDGAVARVVDARVAALPLRSRELWQSLRPR